MDWIPCHLPWRLVYDNGATEDDSFTTRGLNQPGTLVEIEEYGMRTQYLIGHINPLRGVCDDCDAFKADALVVRYAVIWAAQEKSS